MRRLEPDERRYGVVRDRYERRMHLELAVQRGDFIHVRVWVGREMLCMLDIDEMGLLTLMQASEQALKDVLHMTPRGEQP